MDRTVISLYHHHFSPNDEELFFLHTKVAVHDHEFVATEKAIEDHVAKNEKENR